MNFIDPHKQYLNFFLVAEIESKKSNCIRNKVGVVFVNDNRVIAKGYNESLEPCKECYREANKIKSGTELEKCNALHAEQMALIDYPKSVFRDSIAFIYGHEKPCAICTRLMYRAGVSSVRCLTKDAVYFYTVLDLMKEYAFWI